jgi:pimeloyl-ACP methyl ester carboxylesterase
MPATFMTQASDPLYRYLDDLPKLKSDQKIERHSPTIDYLEEEARVLRSYRIQRAAPPERPLRPTRGAINRRYVDLSSGQVLVRSSGESRGGRPLLLLHDGRASSRMFEPLMRLLGRHRPVYAPDLPDNGASDPLKAHRPAIADYAEAVAATMLEMRLSSSDIYAVGAGSVVALELLKLRGFARARALLETPDFYSSAFSRRLLHQWAPPLAPDREGAYLNKLWLMLRDEYAYWPWFDQSASAAVALDVPADSRELHARAVEILRSLSTYHRLTAAALRYDWASALRRLRQRSIIMAATESDPRRLHTEAAAELTSIKRPVVLPKNVPEKAHAVLRALRG